MSRRPEPIPTPRRREPAPQDPAINVRELATPDHFRRCQQVQQRAWGIADDGYLMPVSLLVSMQKYGGLVLGAFRADELVGFSFAFLARIGRELGLYSQLTAVLPEQQGRGVGFLLKQEQRAEARRRGLKLLFWAFDPLQAGNAFFNLAKLGAVCRSYEVDMYGSRTDPLNAGLPTDRLIAQWQVDDTREGLQAGAGSAHRLLTLCPDGSWLRPELAALPSGPRLELDIPPSIQDLKRERADLAPLWQQCVREAFLAAFERGYVATGFVRSRDGRRCWYLLERERPDAD